MGTYSAHGSVQQLLAEGSEYLPDAQGLRDLYFLGKAQAMSMPSVSSPSLRYQSRAPLLPAMEPVRYGRREQESGLQNLLDLEKKGYPSTFSYSAPPNELVRLYAYRQ